MTALAVREDQMQISTAVQGFVEAVRNERSKPLHPAVLLEQALVFMWTKLQSSERKIVKVTGTVKMA